MYTKLANSILTSTVWMESDQTRIVWMTLLAMCDKNGDVQASIPGLANVARVPIEAVEAAIEVFMSPDPYSRTKSDEGRRIEEIEGGWTLLNHEKYRDLASNSDRKAKSAQRQKRHRDRQKRNGSVTRNAKSVTEHPETVTACDKSRQIPHTDTDTDTEEKETIKEKSASVTAYTPGPGIVVPPRINLPEVIDAVGAWVHWRYFKDVQHSVFSDSPQEQSVWVTINRWEVSPEQIITRLHECVANGWNRLVAPESPLHHSEAAATDLEDTWDALTTFLGKIPPGETYTDRITAKFGSKVAALVKKFGYNEIKTANDFEDSRMKKRFVREMQS